MCRTKSLPETWRVCGGTAPVGSGGCGRLLELTLANFGRHLTGRNGWMPKCRECTRAYKRALAKGHRDRRDKVLLQAALKPGQRCPECAGMSHRRPHAGCPRCMAAYASLPPVELVFRRNWSWAV